MAQRRAVTHKAMDAPATKGIVPETNPADQLDVAPPLPRNSDILAELHREAHEAICLATVEARRCRANEPVDDQVQAWYRTHVLRAKRLRLFLTPRENSTVGNAAAEYMAAEVDASGSIELAICLDTIARIFEQLDERLLSALTPTPEGQLVPAAGLDGPPRRGMPIEEANEKAMALAKASRRFLEKPNAREWARQIGCSPSTIVNTPLWIATMAKTGRSKKKAQRPRAISFTPEIQDVVGQGERDDALNKLIAEQASDHEASPLDAFPAHRLPRARKRL